MAYGATGSGKTHTLHGPSSSSSCTIQAPSTFSPDASTHSVHPLAGVAPRACAAALTALKRRCRIAKAKGLVAPQLFCSYVQVYGNEVTDLLEGGGQQAIGAWGGVAAAAIAQGAAEVTVADAAHMQQVHLSTMKSKPQSSYIHQLLLTAESNKRRAATAMNERSRSPHQPPPSRVCWALTSPPCLQPRALHSHAANDARSGRVAAGSQQAGDCGLGRLREGGAGAGARRV